MALPLNYALRNAAVRKTSFLLTALGIAMTVAVFAGVISLRTGFLQLFAPRGEENVAVYLRPGANSEGESGITRAEAQIIIKERPEIVRDSNGQSVAAAETFLAVYREKVGGGQTNVPIRGIQPSTLEIHRDLFEMVEGRRLEFGTDEVMVGRATSKRIVNCALGNTLQINMAPFKVVGIFDHPGAYGSEIWGDVDRMMEALDRPVFQRVVARVKPGTDFEALDRALRKDERTPLQVHSEQQYFKAQSVDFGDVLLNLAVFLTFIMGIAAVLGAMNTMISAVSARTHEIGVLLAIGFPRRSILLSFLLESAVTGLVGGALGVLLILPFHGYETGTTNFQTFTDVSFAFRVTPELVGISFGVAFLLGLVGGAIPAIRASLLAPVTALRQE